MYSIKYVKICAYDYLWYKTKKRQFSERVRVLYAQMRFDKKPLKKVPKDMCNFTDFDKMKNDYKKHMNSFFSLVD